MDCFLHLEGPRIPRSLFYANWIPSPNLHPSRCKNLARKHGRKFSPQRCYRSSNLQQLHLCCLGHHTTPNPQETQMQGAALHFKSYTYLPSSFQSRHRSPLSWVSAAIRNRCKEGRKKKTTVEFEENLRRI